MDEEEEPVPSADPPHGPELPGWDGHPKPTPAASKPPAAGTSALTSIPPKTLQPPGLPQLKISPARKSSKSIFHGINLSVAAVRGVAAFVKHSLCPQKFSFAVKGKEK